MADKSFGVRQLNLIGPSGTPTINSPNNLNVNAVTVAISTDVSIGGQITSNVIVGSGKSVGIGSILPSANLDVGGSIRTQQLNVTGVSTFAGITTVTGQTLFAKQVNVSGVGTFRDDLVLYDSTNPVAMWDSSQNRFEFNNDTPVTFGNSSELQLYYAVSTNESVIESYSNRPLNIKTSPLSSSAGNAITRLTISNNGINVSGTTTTSTLNVSGFSTFSNLSVSGFSTFSNIATFDSVAKFNDNKDIVFGTLENASIRYSTATSSLRIFANNTTTNLITDNFNVTSNSKNALKTYKDAQVELYYDNSKKFETIGAGVTVTGTTFTNQLNVSGVGTFNSLLNVVSSNFTGAYESNRISFRTGEVVISSVSNTLRLQPSTTDNSGSILFFSRLGVTGGSLIFRNSTILDFNLSGDINVSGNANISGVTTVGVVTGTSATYYGTGSNLLTSSAAAGIGVTTAISRSISSKFSDIVSVEDFGAVGNGIVDDSLAFQAALNASPVVFIPAGEYLITQELEIPDRNTYIFGGGVGISSIVAGSSFSGTLFKNKNSAFTSHDRVFVIRDLSVLTKAGGSSSASGTAFYLRWPSSDSGPYPSSDGSSAGLQYRRKLRARFDNVTIAQYTEGTNASPSNQGWQNGIYFENCCYAMVTNCSLTGHGTGSGSGSISIPAASEAACTVSQNAIVWTGTPSYAMSSVELWLTNCVIHRWNYGLVVNQEAEGINIVGGSFVVCGTGVYWSTTNRKPHLSITDTHMSVFNNAVYTSEVEEIFISNCLFYIHQQANGATDMIKLINPINAKITNNVLRSRSNFDHNAINIDSTTSTGAQYVLISGNTIGGSENCAVAGQCTGAGNARFNRVIVCNGSGTYTNIKLRDNQYIGYLDGFSTFSASAVGNVITDGIEGALVYNSDAAADAGSISVSNETETVITWDSATRESGRTEPSSSYPPGSVGGYGQQWFNSSSSSSRITIPFGASRVRITAQVSWQANSSGYRRVYFKKGGTADFIGNCSVTSVPVPTSGTTPPMPGSGAHETVVLITTPIIPVSGGEYFELYVWQNSGSTLAVAKRKWKTWISIEKIG